MGVDLEKLVVQMSADIKGYENAMRRAENVTRAEIKKIEDRYRQMGGVLSGALTAPLAGLGAALSTREVLRYADAWTQAGNLVRAAAQASGVQTRSLEELRAGADQARVSLEAYTGLYANLIRSASGVAKSEEEIARATDLVSKAMKAGGASTQEQQSAIQQLGQALTSGVLQGDEFRSLRENAPVLAAAIAKEFETTVGGLKKLSEEGKLSADRVFRAILNYGPQIEAQFDSTNQTIAEGFIRIGNALTEYVGTMAQSVGLTTAVNSILGALAGNIDTVANAAAAAAVIMLSRYAPAMTRVAAGQALVLATNPFLLVATAVAAATIAVAEFGDEIRPVAGEMANLQDYTGTIWDSISSGAGTAASATADAFLAIINGIADAIGGIQVSWSDVGSFVKDVINGMIGGVVALYEIVKANFTVLPNVIGAAVVGAMNAMISTVEAAINQIIGEINGLNSLVNSASSAVGLGNIIPELNKVAFGRFQNDYVAAAKETGAAAAKAIGDAMTTDYLGDAFDTVNARANERAQRRSETAGTTYDAPSNEGYGNAPTLSDSGGGSGGKGKKKKQNDLEKEIEQITRRTAALTAETAAQAGLNPLVDDYGYAVARAKAMQDLETAAKEAGIEVTDAQRQRMEQLAESYARAVEESNRLADSQDRLRQSAEDWRALSEDASKGFVKDLIEGKSAADALSNALGRIGDKLIDMAFDSLFDSKTGAAGGIGNAIASALSTAFGGAREGGGPVTAGKAYVVGEKRPELFVPNQSGVIIPKIPAARSSGAASGAGVHVTFAADVDASGNLRPFVTSVSDDRIGRAAPAMTRRSVQAVREANRESAGYLGG